MSRKTDIYEAEVICDARAEFCHCAFTPGHDGPHECGRDGCGGSWLGDIGTDSFKIVRFPGEGGTLACLPTRSDW